MARFAVVMQSLRECPWVKPLFLRLALSIVVILYVITGAAIFVVMLAPSPQDLYVREKAGRIRNETAALMVAEFQGTRDPDKMAQALARILRTYEHELDRGRSLSPVDELLLSLKDSGTVRRSYRGTDFENALYFTLSLLTATASGNLLRLPDLTQFVVLLYTAIGIPLMLSWIVLMGRSMAQFWIMLCLHTCCCGMSPVGRAETSLFKRFLARVSRRRAVTPELNSKRNPGSTGASSNSISIIDELITSERNVLVQPENVDDYFRLVRSDLIVPAWTLCLFLILYAVFGATFAALSHGVSFMTAFFYGYLVFTTIGGVTPNLGLNTLPTSHLARFSGEDIFAFIVVQQDRASKVIWMLYFLIGYVLLAGLLYLGYLILTWRCSFCRENGTRRSEEDSVPEKISIGPDMTMDNRTPVEILPRRMSAQSMTFNGYQKMMDSRRSSIATLRHASLELTSSDIETTELRTLAEADEEAEMDSDSGISKSSSERVNGGDRAPSRPEVPTQRSRSVSTEDVVNRNGAMSAASKHSAKSVRTLRRQSSVGMGLRPENDVSIEEDLRDEVDPEDLEGQGSSNSDEEPTSRPTSKA